MIKKLLMAAVILATAVPAAAQGSRRSEVSVSYGVAPVTDWIDSYSNILTGVIAGSDSDLTGWGTVTVGYSFRVIGSLRIGAQVAYSSNTQEIKKTGSEIKNRYWTLMPNVKWNWLNLKIVSSIRGWVRALRSPRPRSGNRATNPRFSPFRCRPSASRSADVSRLMPKRVSEPRAACWSERGTASDRKIEKKTYLSGKSSFFNG